MVVAEQRQLALTVRHPFENERIPLPFGLWDPSLPFTYDREWIWGAYSPEGVMYAIFITSPLHGFVNLVKAYAAPDAPKGWFLKVLRCAVREWRKRGYRGFYMVTDGSGIEGKMVRMVRRHSRALNAIVHPFEGVVLCGAIKDGML